jgi:hypothetical protein
MLVAVLLHPERAVLDGYEHSHSAGVEFIEENGGSTGLRMRKDRRS